MKIIACYSLKGGVGKTTSAVNLAYLAANQGQPTLLWDLEAQGASSFYFRVKPKLKGGCAGLIGGDHELARLIKATDFPQLDLLPADFSFRNVDLCLDDINKPRQRLAKLLHPLAEDYAYVFLDCPPSSSLLAEAVWCVANAVLMPVAPSPFSSECLARTYKFVGKQGFDARRLLPFVSMLDKRKPLHREQAQQLAAAYPQLLASAVPYAPAVERMALERLPLAAFAPRCSAVQAYQNLWQEVLQVLT